MGVYDRDYYRESRPGTYWFREHLVTPWLAVVHVGVYVLQLVTANRQGHGTFTDLFMFHVERFTQGEIWRVVTGLFIHDLHNWLNLVWNVLIIWFFGRQMEEIYGGRKFLLLYLLAGAIGNLAWAFGYWVWRVPAPVILFGAAPAVTFLLTLCTLHNPRQTVCLFFVLPVPLWVVTGLYVGKDLVVFLRQLGGMAAPSLAIVHLVGAACAAGYYFAPKGSWQLADWRPFCREQLSMTRPRRARAWDEHLEAQADAILDKLNRQGKDALTAEEWEILHRASEAYRRRR